MVFEKFLHGADYNYEQWLDRSDILEKDFLYMKEVKANVMSIGIFSWAMLEPEEGQYNFKWLDNLMDRLAANGQKAILATPSGSKPAWMSYNYPEVCRVDEKGIREKHGGRHNHCRTSLVYRDKCREMNTLLAKRYAKHPALFMYHVSNEYNGVPCFCENCIAEFRSWLEHKYKTLDNLNKAWWTTFWSHRFTEWNQIFPNDGSIQGMILDWRRFNSELTINFFNNEIVPLRKYTPDIPITTNFQFPDVWLDYHMFAKKVDVVSWDSYPDWHLYDSEIDEAIKTAFMHDLYRSAKKSPFMLMESTPSSLNWKPQARQKKEGMTELASVQAIAHGSNSVQYFQWRQSRGGEEKFHSAVVSHIGSDNTRIFKDITKVGELLDRLSKNKDLLSTVDKSEVAIVYDFQNGWAIDGAGLPRNNRKNYQAECIEHYKAFYKKGIQCDIISAELEDISEYKILILPMLYMFPDGTQEKLKAFVENGGSLVATYLTGTVDSTDLCYLGGTPGNLTDLFGLKVEQNGVIADNEKAEFSFNGKKYNSVDYIDIIQLDNAQVISKYDSPDFIDMPSLTKNKFGKGEAYYLCARNKADFLKDFYSQICKEKNISSFFTGEIPEGLSVQKRGPVKFFMNFGNDDVSFSYNGKQINLKSLAYCIEGLD